MGVPHEFAIGVFSSLYSGSYGPLLITGVFGGPLLYQAIDVVTFLGASTQVGLLNFKNELFLHDICTFSSRTGVKTRWWQLKDFCYFHPEP